MNGQTEMQDRIRELEDALRQARSSEAEAREIHYISRREEYGEGEKLFVEGNPAVEIFLIVEGEVDVVKKGVEERPTTLATARSSRPSRAVWRW